MERDEAAFADGCEAAAADLATGRLVYRWSGHAGHWGHWITIQLAERFGVTVEGLGVCFVTTSSISFNDGYNSVVVREIDRRHGPGTIRALHAESRVQSEESLWDAKLLCLERVGLTEAGARPDRRGR